MGRVARGLQANREADFGAGIGWTDRGRGTLARESIGTLAGTRSWRVDALDGLCGDHLGAWIVWTACVERILARGLSGTLALGGFWRENPLPGSR